MATATRGTTATLKTDFINAITQLSAEKNLPKEVVFEAVEVALASAYKKDALADCNLIAKIDGGTGDVHVYAQREIVHEVEDEATQIGLDAAREISPSSSIGDVLNFEVMVENAGRIAAQTAKQVVLQRLREAEREVVFEEYSGKEGDIISGVVHRLEGRHVFIDLGKAEAVLPPSEQVRIEHYRPGQRLKVYLVEVHKANRGPQVTVSRSHKNLLRRLFELEVPEIFRGSVEIKSIAREPGFRSKVAVYARLEGIDPVGACVGLRGIRIQNIVNELNGERIDVVQWDPDPARFVANALSPAQVHSVRLDMAENTAEVVVADRQLSLAIGKEGQNARLAAKLTGMRIDIKSLSAVEEAGELDLPPVPEPTLAPKAVWEEVVETASAEPAAETGVEEPEVEEAAAALEIEAPPPVADTAGRPAAIRFADEVMPAARPDPAAPTKGRKVRSSSGRKGPVRESEEAARARRAAASKRGRRPMEEIEAGLEEAEEDEDIDFSLLTGEQLDIGADANDEEE